MKVANQDKYGYPVQPEERVTGAEPETINLKHAALQNGSNITITEVRALIDAEWCFIRSCVIFYRCRFVRSVFQPAKHPILLGRSENSHARPYERVTIPFVDIFGERPADIDFSFYRLAPETLTGRKETTTTL